MKILALGPNSTKFYTHNLWATRRLEMQKLDAGGEVMGWWCRRPGEGVGVEWGGGCLVGCRAMQGWGVGVQGS